MSKELKSCYCRGKNVVLYSFQTDEESRAYRVTIRCIDSGLQTGETKEELYLSCPNITRYGKTKAEAKRLAIQAWNARVDDIEKCLDKIAIRKRYEWMSWITK